jgi:poly(A) polymerase
LVGVEFIYQGHRMIRRFIKKIFGGSDEGASLPKVSKTRLKTYAGQDLGIDLKLVSPNAIRVCENLQQAGYQAYIVGGAVRDLVLGITPKDFDVATNATPEQVKAHSRRAMIIGKRFRLVHVIFGREVIETATYRALQTDALTDEHGRVLRDNQFGSQAEDAARRDFTANALYYDPINDQVLDYHDGVSDIKKKRLRMIGDPATRYREDPVRMLRSVRFAAKLGFSIDAPTRAPIRDMAELLNNVPSARLFDEMLKLLSSGHAMSCLRKLREEGLHHGILPLLDVVLEEDKHQRFIELALARTDERVHAGKSVSPGYLFASLLWPLVAERWQQQLAAGEHSNPALKSAIDSVLAEQAERLAIQRRYQSDMLEIWTMQPRFERRSGHGAFRLLEHPRFRAGFDFLLMRGEAQEADAELTGWWQAFEAADNKEREDLVLQLRNRPSSSGKSGSGSSKRRRRKPAKAGSHESSNTSEGSPSVDPSASSD